MIHLFQILVLEHNVRNLRCVNSMSNATPSADVEIHAPWNSPLFVDLMARHTPMSALYDRKLAELGKPLILFIGESVVQVL